MKNFMDRHIPKMGAIALVCIAVALVAQFGRWVG